MLKALSFVIHFSQHHAATSTSAIVANVFALNETRVLQTWLLIALNKTEMFLHSKLILCRQFYDIKSSY